MNDALENKRNQFLCLEAIHKFTGDDTEKIIYRIPMDGRLGVALIEEDVVLQSLEFQGLIIFHDSQRISFSITKEGIKAYLGVRSSKQSTDYFPPFNNMFSENEQNN